VPKVQQALKSYWAHLIDLLDDVGQGEARLGLFGDSVNLGTRKVHDLRRTYHTLRNHFGHTRWYSVVTWVKWKLVRACLENVNNIPYAQKSFWTHPMVLRRDVGQVEARLGLFGEC
jgi:hypothetical protein